MPASAVTITLPGSNVCRSAVITSNCREHPALDGSFLHLESCDKIGGGRGGIRTHGGLPHARFRVECLKPDSATLPFSQDRHPADRFLLERVYYEARAIICKSASSFGNRCAHRTFLTNGSNRNKRRLEQSWLRH